jgi:SAM-dependent methyltransferase/uncharacterized protein YbaR (Trm112 family)
MQERFLALLRCPVSRSSLELQVITRAFKSFSNGTEEIIQEGILYATEGWFYPVIRGVPRLNVEAFRDYETFFLLHLSDYALRRRKLEDSYPGLIRYVITKNKRTKKSFSLEWSLFNYQDDKTWEAGKDELLQRFLDETGETAETLTGKLIFDAGCGNGQLDPFIAKSGATVVAMDFSDSIEQAYQQNSYSSVHFIQGDIQYPPVAFSQFDIVHSSGVLNHTNNAELSFASLESCVRPGGKLSVWLYHPGKGLIHRLFNRLRSLTSKWPLGFQYYFLLTTLFPVSWVIKRLKGNKQNRREMMIALLDWFSPEFRWEQEQDEAASWFTKRGYHAVQTTTTNLFGFNIIGIK